MPNSIHLQELNKGAKSWNKWRTANKKIIPDLSDADLSETNLMVLPNVEGIKLADMRKYNLSKANLKNANLIGVNLEGANLSFADLSGADLDTANLRKTNLKNANLQKAKLNEAQLHEANLMNANLSEAELTEANLKKANLKNAQLQKVDADYVTIIQTNFSGANLTEAKMVDANGHGANFRKATLCKVDLNGANLRDTNFSEADLTEANLSFTSLGKSNLQKANLTQSKFAGAGMIECNLSKANCTQSKLSNTYLVRANLMQCNLENANLSTSNLSEANLTKANLKAANLYRATMVRTNLSKTILDDASIYGISAWDIAGDPKSQNNLIITPRELPEITVDELEVAQFVYLLLNNAKIRNAIDTITSKAVLILGRFYTERKMVLDALREELRKRNYIPIVFDFDKPTSKDLTESVQTLAQMSRFVIADITDAKSIPQELSYIIPTNPSLPIAAIIAKKFEAYSMYEHFERYPWVLPLYKYKSQKQLLSVIKEKIIDPAERKVEELKPKELW